MDATAITRSWRQFLIDNALARQYPVFFDITSVTVRGVPRNPILEELLPSLLQIKAVTVLDEALRAKLKANGHKPSDLGFKNDLNGRLETALATGILNDVSLLHRARGSRNDVAHEFEEKVTWTQLDADVVAVNAALQQMGFVGDLPHLEVTADRNPKAVLTDPNAALGFDYVVAVRDSSTVLAEITWSEEIMSVGLD